MARAVCTSFKKELLMAVHNFAAAGGHTFKLALFTASATLDETTTAYSSTNETSGAGYTAGGFTCVNVDPSTSGTTAMLTFSTNPTWTSASFSASQALLYNTSASNKAVLVLDFGGTQTVTVGSFVVTLPAVTPTTALLCLA